MGLGVGFRSGRDTVSLHAVSDRFLMLRNQVRNMSNEQCTYFFMFVCTYVYMCMHSVMAPCPETVGILLP